MYKNMLILKCDTCLKLLGSDTDVGHGEPKDMQIGVHCEEETFTYQINNDKEYILCQSCHDKYHVLTGVMPRPLSEFE